MRQCQRGEDRDDPWQWSTHECSTIEFPSQGASRDVHVLPVFKVGAIPTPVCLCNKSSAIKFVVVINDRHAKIHICRYSILNSVSQFFDTM